MHDIRKIDAFLGRGPFAVAGASTDRRKYGNKVLRCYQQHGLQAFPVNPRAAEIEGAACYPDLASIPASVHGLSVITPPRITETLVEDAAACGIPWIWMQPGAESPRALRRADELGLGVIAGGACLLVVLGYSERS